MQLAGPFKFNASNFYVAPKFSKTFQNPYRKLWIGCRLVKFRFGRFQMRIISTHILLICFDLVVFCAVGADYRYKECVPSTCGGRNSPNISFPFYVLGKRQPYCGYHRFKSVNCVNELPIINLLGNQYVIEDIQYESKSLRVYAADAASISGDGVCYSRLNNMTEAWGDFKLADNVTMLHLFSNCSVSLPENHFKNGSVCEGINDDWVWPLYESDENYSLALRNCSGHVTVPVERQAGMDTGRNLRNGFVVKWIASDCTECSDSHGRCGFNGTTHLFKCFCPDRPHSRSCKPENNRATVVLVSAASGGGLFILISLLVSLIIWRRKQRSNRAYLLSRTISKTDLEGGSTYYGIPIFSYAELKVATGDFDSSNELGDGGFGTVYYGNLKDGREVAVKRLYEHNNRRMEQYLNEIKILTCLRHPHLVSLYGCTSRRSQELILVYEYISNGTVADHLHGMRAKDAPLSWEVRMKIALETADALAYLHKSDIIHRDVKTDNILLDKNFCVKVADFGLSRLFPSAATHVSTAPQGTPGYVDPEYHQFYQLTDKSDVYSFGVVLIELVSSMPAVDISRHRHEINLANLAINKIQMRAFDDLIDTSLGHETNEEVQRMTTSVAELAFQCLQLEKDMRPSMDEVLSTLIVIEGSKKLTVERVKQSSSSLSMSETMAAASPETTDDMMLLRGKKFQSSPNAVTDVWVSSSTVSGSVSGFGEIIKQENL